jgi:hypothetical protein
MDGDPIERIIPQPPLWPGFWSRAEHGIRLTVWTSVTGLTVTVTGVVGGPDGVTRPFLYTLGNPPGTRAATAQVFTLEEGVLLAVQVYASGALLTRGQCYVRLELMQGVAASALSLGTILADYVTSNVPAAYPGAGIRHSLDGPGALRSITQANPAAGADLSITVPANVRWRLWTFRAQFISSAVVATRIPQLQLTDGTNIVYEAASATQGASQNITNEWSPAGAADRTTSGNAVNNAAGFPLWLAAGWQLKTQTLLIDVGDQWGNIDYVVEEWIDVG